VNSIWCSVSPPKPSSSLRRWRTFCLIPCAKTDDLKRAIAVYNTLAARLDLISRLPALCRTDDLFSRSQTHAAQPQAPAAPRLTALPLTRSAALRRKGG
jgi:hypothetical protein